MFPRIAGLQKVPKKLGTADEDHPRHEQHESRVPPWDSGITTAEAAPSLRFLQEPALSNAEGVGISAADTMGVWLVRWTRP